MTISDFNHIESASAPDTIVREALLWAADHINDPFTKGSVMILDNRVKVNFEEVELRHAGDAMLEAHRRFIDIHVPLLHPEAIGWAVSDDLQIVSRPYDTDSDIEFFSDPFQATVEIKCGQFAVLYPEDAHAPNIGNGIHRKMCIKIPV